MVTFWKCKGCLKFNHETTCWKCGKNVHMEMPDMQDVGKRGNG